MMEFHQAPQTFVSQVDLKVSDLERSLAFYQQIIGFQIIKQTDKVAFLTADGKTPLVKIEQPDNVREKQSRTTGLYHFAILLPSRKDLGMILQHFLEVGYPLQGVSDHLVSEAIYLADPDGNGIEIYADRPASTWVWNDGQVHMTTEPIDAHGLLAEGRGQKWEGLPSGTTMGHIHLHVAELEKVEEFYCKGLGFNIVTRYGNQAIFLSTGGYHHHIGLNTWNGIGAPKPADNSVGLKWFTLQFPSEEARQQVIENLRRLEVMVSEVEGSYFIEDPSGNRIQLNI